MKKKYNSPMVLIAELGAVSLAVTSSLDGGYEGNPGDHAEARERKKRCNYYNVEDVFDIDDALEPEF